MLSEIHEHKLKTQKSKLHSLIAHCYKNPSGFTLIEIMVVVGTLGVLSTIGVASFVSYSRTQAMNAATFDVITSINLAKSRARTQYKPSSGSCNSSVLDGYLVRIVDDITYSLEVSCEGSTYPTPDGTKVLPNNSSGRNITFSAASRNKVFLFKVLSGSVQMPGGLANDTIVINGYGITKTVTISSNGKIAIN
jgi:prepilin-type N-terminal cleavage/methylation domain-containing protein